MLCTACKPQDLPEAGSSDAPIATQSSLATTEPASTFVPAPTITPTLLLTSPTPIFDVVIDNVAISQ